jgi:hypothetical protein
MTGTRGDVRVLLDRHDSSAAGPGLLVAPDHLMTIELDGSPSLTQSGYAAPPSTVTITDPLQPLGTSESSAPGAGTSTHATAFPINPN